MKVRGAAWAIGCGWMAAVAATAGCSERSLLQMEVTVKPDMDLADPGPLTLDFDVRQGDRMIRHVSTPQPVLLSLTQATPVQVGVYLDHEVSGSVTVTVTVTNMKGCSLTTATVTANCVAPGKTCPASISVLVTATETCPTTPPGGGTGGMTGGGSGGSDGTGGATVDASVDVNASPEVEPPVDAGDPDVFCPEVGTDAGPLPSCDDFCDASVKNCPSNFRDRSECMSTCKTWTVGTLPTAMDATVDENTLGCRQFFVSTNQRNPNLMVSQCAAAAANSTRCTR